MNRDRRFALDFVGMSNPRMTGQIILQTLHLPQPNLWIKGCGILENLKSQLGNTFLVREDFANFLIGRHLLSSLYKDFLQASINGKVLPVVDDNCAPQCWDKSYFPNLTFKN
jgi:hypothetical protein